jgi:hypothetical protein
MHAGLRSRFFITHNRHSLKNQEDRPRAHSTGLIPELENPTINMHHFPRLAVEPIHFIFLLTALLLQLAVQ